MTRTYNEGIEPMLSSCSNRVTRLCKEESSRLPELLSLLNEFRPCLGAKKSSEVLIVELLDWEGLTKIQTKNCNKYLESSGRSLQLR